MSSNSSIHHPSKKDNRANAMLQLRSRGLFDFLHRLPRKRGALLQYGFMHNAQAAVAMLAVDIEPSRNGKSQAHLQLLFLKDSRPSRNGKSKACFGGNPFSMEPAQVEAASPKERAEGADDSFGIGASIGRCKSLGWCSCRCQSWPQCQPTCWH